MQSQLNTQPLGVVGQAPKISDEEIREAILSNNEWVGGWVDFKEGDITAIANACEDYGSVTHVKSVKELYQYLQTYDGIFKYRDLIIVNHWNYGTFVYKLPDLKNYVEHLSMDVITLKEFKDIIKELVGGGK